MTGSFSYWLLRCDDLATRTARICRSVASVRGRLAAVHVPLVASCHRSTMPSLSVSSPYCAFRLTTSLTSGATGHCWGLLLRAQRVRGGIDGIRDAGHRFGLPEMTSDAATAAVAQIAATGVTVSVANPVAASTRAARVDRRHRARGALDGGDDVLRTEPHRAVDDVRVDGRRLHEWNRRRKRARPPVEHGNLVRIVGGRAGFDEHRDRAQHCALVEGRRRRRDAITRWRIAART